MKIQDIQVGKRYWVEFGSGVQIGTVRAKSEDAVVVELKWDVALREPKQFIAEVIEPPPSDCLPWYRRLWH